MENIERMELQYIWIDKWRCFSNTEVNFTDLFNIHYDYEKRSLSGIERKETGNKDLFGEDITLTAVVGRNGAGKSSLFKYLRTFAYGTNHVSEDMGRFIAVFSEDGKIKKVWYHDWNGELLTQDCIDRLVRDDIKIEEMYPEKDNTDHKSWNDRFGDKFRFIYYSNTFGDDSMEWAGQNILSPAVELWKEIDAEKNGIQAIRNYWMKAFERQMDFVFKNHELMDDFEINWSKKIYISLQPDGTIRRWQESKINAGKARIIEGLFSDGPNDDGFVVSFSKTIAYAIAVLYQDFFEWEKQLEQNDRKKGALEKLNNLLSYFSKSEIKYSFVDPLKNFIDQFAKFKKSPLLCENNYVLEYSTFDEEQNPNMESFEAFFASYKNLRNFPSFMGFSWGLSTGEMVLLDSFSKIFALTKEDKNGKRYLYNPSFDRVANKNAILMLDEAEVSLNPEWQRLYLNAMLNFLSTCLRKTHVQVIVATHSPIILSDIPKSHIVYLRTDEKGNTIVDSNSEHKETFGANILQIYNDAFFMKDFIGKFSKKKIERAIKQLYDAYSNKNALGQEEMKAIEDLIRIIGEPLLKRDIERMIKRDC